MDDRPSLAMPGVAYPKSIRRVVSLSERKFDITTLPEDLQRVYHKLEATVRSNNEWGLESLETHCHFLKNSFTSFFDVVFCFILDL